jgi:hypothetical protein
MHPVHPEVVLLHLLLLRVREVTLLLHLVQEVVLLLLQEVVLEVLLQVEVRVTQKLLMILKSKKLRVQSKRSIYTASMVC